MLLIISVLAENTLLKTACHFLLLLVVFNTLTYRKNYDRSPILVGHHIAPEIDSDAAVHPVDIAPEIDSDVAVSPADIAPEINSHAVVHAVVIARQIDDKK